MTRTFGFLHPEVLPTAQLPYLIRPRVVEKIMDPSHTGTAFGQSRRIIKLLEHTSDVPLKKRRAGPCCNLCKPLVERRLLAFCKLPSMARKRHICHCAWQRTFSYDDENKARQRINAANAQDRSQTPALRSQRRGHGEWQGSTT